MSRREVEPCPGIPRVTAIQIMNRPDEKEEGFHRTEHRIMLHGSRASGYLAVEILSGQDASSEKIWLPALPAPPKRTG